MLTADLATIAEPDRAYAERLLALSPALAIVRDVAQRFAALVRAHAADEGGERWAAIASLVETCKLNGINPQTYFTDLLTRLVNGWPQARIDKLMPWDGKPAAT